MKYIRTFSGIIVDTEQQAKRLGMSVEEYESKFPYSYSTKANTIEELCDLVVYVPKGESKPNKSFPPLFNIVQINEINAALGNRYENYDLDCFYYGIWTDKGLIYVAKMNDKGELELL